jgi:hypothetical protein
VEGVHRLIRQWDTCLSARCKRFNGFSSFDQNDPPTRLVSKSLKLKRSTQQSTKVLNSVELMKRPYPCSKRPVLKYRTRGRLPQLTREWSGLSGRNHTWNFSLHSPSNNACTQNSRSIRVWKNCANLERTVQIRVGLAVALYYPVHLNRVPGPDANEVAKELKNVSHTHTLKKWVYWDQCRTCSYDRSVGKKNSF